MLLLYIMYIIKYNMLLYIIMFLIQN